MRLEEAFYQLDRCLQRRMQVFRCSSLSVALTDQDRLLHLAAFACSGQEQPQPAPVGLRFAIGSIGKVFTAIACLQAAERGLLDLQAPVKNYLPWFEIKSPYPPITLHHLLTHSSGLPRGTDFSPDPRSEVYALRDCQAGFAPGAHFSYSDAGYKVLGLALEQVMGKPYAEIITEGILEPLEMTSTTAATTSQVRPLAAIGYCDMYDDRPAHASHPLVPAPWVETNSGDGCLISTAEDMARFARMLLNEGQGPRGRILSEPAFRKMILPMVDDEGDAYSYGLHLFEDEGYRYAGHGGDVPGFEAYLWMDLDNRLGTVVLMTTPHARRASFIALEFFREAYLGHRLPEQPPIPDFTYVMDPEEYAGRYRAGGFDLRLRAEGNHLALVWKGQEIVLEEREIGRFYINHPDWNLHLLSFERGEDGSVCEASYGPLWFTNDRYTGPRDFPYPPEWDGYCGHYRAHNPWSSNFRVYLRKGKLLRCQPSGEEEVLVPLGGNVFRIGEEEWIPERMRFEQVVDGQALCAYDSTCPYYRFFTP